MKMLGCLLLVLALCVGCTHNQTFLKPDGNLKQITSTANTSQMNGEGLQQATNLGIGPQLSKADAEGIWVNGPGASGIAAILLEQGTLYVNSPQDVVIEGLEIIRDPTSGEITIKADSMNLNLSEPMGKQVDAYLQAAKSLEGLTQTEALATVERMRAAGEITDSIASLLLQYFVPGLSP